MTLKHLLPESARRPLRWIRHLLRFVPMLGVSRYCPVCRMPSRRFGPYGVVPTREDAMCLYCGALERHRLVWLYFRMQTDLFDGGPRRVLHVAPERMFEPRLRRRLGSGYLTADLNDSRAMVKMNVMDIPYASESFDVIYCSHVLEHVSDDGLALREFNRVLKPNGWVILLVPISAERTFEDPRVTDPGERLKLFGREDHVRRYGPDFPRRVEAAGFTVRTIAGREFLTDRQMSRMGITEGAGDIYLAAKQQVHTA